MRIEAVSSRKLRNDFVNVPWRVYRDDPLWVPPLHSDARNLMNPRKNPFHKYALIEHFVAFDDAGAPAGRIAACVYPKPGEKGAAGEGAFGFFECINDPAMAKALLRAAEDWLAPRGCNVVSGPYSYCATQDSGLLCSGFETPPTVFQTYNPPYYQKLIEDAGYSTKYGATAYTFTAESFTATPAGGEVADFSQALSSGPLFAAGEAFRAKKGLTVRRLNMKRYAEDMEVIRNLLNITFSGNEGVLPVSDDVFAHQTSQLKPFVDPNLVAIVERNGKPVAFTFLVPDVFRILKTLNGRISLLSLLTLKQKVRSLDTAVILLVGALPDRSLIGVSRLLVAELVGALGRGGYKSATTTWVHEDNKTIHKFARDLAGRPTKTYRILSRNLVAP